MAANLALRTSPSRTFVNNPIPEFHGSSLKGSITPQYGGSIATGYRELSKNKTLAGRQAARHFRGDDRNDQSLNRVKMVSRLRKKEKNMIWRHVLSDLCRYFMTSCMRFFNPISMDYDYVGSAVRFRSR
jgi:hypothetical protein